MLVRLRRGSVGGLVVGIEAVLTADAYRCIMNGLGIQATTDISMVICLGD